MRNNKKIVMCSVIAEAIFKSRRELMEKLIDENFTIVMLAPNPKSEIPKDILNNPNVKYYQINLKRTGINPLNDIQTIRQMRKILNVEKPAYTYAFGGAKAAIYLTIAADKEKIKNNYCMINGLGSIFRGTGLKNLLVKNIMSLLFKISLSKSHGVLFQNSDDLGELVSKKLVSKEKTHIVNGSGVNLGSFPHSEIINPNRFLFVGRLLRDKGIYEFIEAAKKIKSQFKNVEFVIVGGIDDNPTSVSTEEVEEWEKLGIIKYYGKQKEVLKFYQESGVFVLPSYHEGTPRTSLEAMAVGRAILTTDAPGCKETVIEGKNGFMVPIKNATALKNKIEFFIKNPDKVQSMGKESYKIAAERYDVHKVNNEIFKFMKL